LNNCFGCPIQQQKSTTRFFPTAYFQRDKGPFFHISDPKDQLGKHPNRFISTGKD